MAAAVTLARARHSGHRLRKCQATRRSRARRFGITTRNSITASTSCSAATGETLKLIAQVGGDIEQDFQRLPLQLTLHNRFELKAPHLPRRCILLVALLSARGLLFAERIQAARFMLSMRQLKFKLGARHQCVGVAARPRSKQ